MYWCMCFLLIQHNQETAPIPILWVGSGNETTAGVDSGFYEIPESKRYPKNLYLYLHGDWDSEKSRHSSIILMMLKKHIKL